MREREREKKTIISQSCSMKPPEDNFYSSFLFRFVYSKNIIFNGERNKVCLQITEFEIKNPEQHFLTTIILSLVYFVFLLYILETLPCQWAIFYQNLAPP